MKTLTKTLIPALALSFLFTDCFAEYEVKITANDAASGDDFGTSVSVDGDYAIIGARRDDDTFASSGSAYIFKRDGNTWTQEAKLNAADPDVNSDFGRTSSISGDYAIVGASGNDAPQTDVGSAYIFVRSGTSWTQQAKLNASDKTTLDNFGRAVAIDGDYAIVGSYHDDDDGSNSGSAYIFVRSGTTWSQQAKLTANDAAEDDNFGWSVSIDGEYAVISSRWDDDTASNSGSAYVFKREGTTWSQQAKLTASDAAEDDYFGYSVSVSGEYIAIGAYRDDDDGSNSGSAYVFKRDGTTWSQQAKITSSDAVASDYFGWSVALSGDYIIVGSYQDDDDGSSSGSAYLFKRDGTSWNQISKLTSNDAASGDNFGRAVAINENYAIVGVLKDDDDGSSSGSAYFYSVNPFGNGDVTQTVSSNTTISFDEGSGNNLSANEDTGMDIAFTGVTNSANIQCASYPSMPTGTDGISGTVQEVRWEITDAGLAFTNAEIRIDMTTLPVTLSNPSSAIIYHRSTPGSGIFTALTTTVDGNELVGNTASFSEFALGGGDSPLAIELDAFYVHQVGNSIQLNWTTASEKDNKGFNVYRKTRNGFYTQIASYKGNFELLGILNSTVSNNYTFVDDSELRNNEFYTYYISDVETNGVETKHVEQAQTVRFVVEDEIAQTKLDYILEQNFPNPFNPNTTINFQIAKEQSVKLEVYNLKGGLVKELVNEEKGKGSHSANWDGTDSFGNQVSSGTYFYKISAGTFSQTNKMVLLK